jgi:putative methyltransferase (TIGR04325 family)
MTKFRGSYARAITIDVTPPILLRPFQRLWRSLHGRGFHTFEGCYAKFADVPLTDAYDDDDFAQASAAFKLEERRYTAAIGRKVDKIGGVFLPLIASKFASECLIILDFGGGAATGLFDILDYMPGAELTKLSYVLVETSAMCRAVRDKIVPFLRDKFGTSLSMEVVDEIPSCLASPLVVNCAGSIQYVADYVETLSRLAKLSPKFFIVGAPMIEAPTCVCRHNMQKRVASWKFNRAEFIAVMRNLGYACVVMVDQDTPWNSHKNSPVSSNVSMVFHSCSN